MSSTGRGGMGMVLPYAQQGSVYCRDMVFYVPQGRKYNNALDVQVDGNVTVPCPKQQQYWRI